MTVIAEDNQETLYWVDEDDGVLGSVNRKKTHDEKLIHREIALLVYDENKRVLFQKRSMKKRSMPGFRSTSVAGHIRYGHTPDGEMVKEAEEELGLVDKQFIYIGKELIVDDEEKYFKNWFITKIEADYPFKLNKEEVDEVKFLTEGELDSAIKAGQKFNSVFVKRAELFWEGKLKEGLI